MTFRQMQSLGALLLTGLVTGCAGDVAEQFFVRPGRFDYLSCPELVRAAQATARREQELKELIDRAEKESIGVLLAAGSYRTEHLRAKGEQKMQAELIREKNCPPDTEPSRAGQGKEPKRAGHGKKLKGTGEDNR